MSVFMGPALMNMKKQKGERNDEPYLEGFKELGTNSSILPPPRPRSTKKSSASSAGRPPLVIICSWMGARTKHISKYTNAYKKRYPGAGILLVQSQPADMLVRSFEHQRRMLAPVRRVLRSALPSTNAGAEDEEKEEGSSPVILHVFSHGGCNTAIQLLRSMKDTPNSPPAPIDAFVLDSCPGDASFSRSVKAMAISLPKNRALRAVALVAVYITLAVFYVFVLLGLRKGTQHMRKELIDPKIFAKETKRLYLYSKADEMVDYKAVTRHSEEAEAAGYVVEAELFEKGPHCGHVMEDEERYWAAVKRVWPAGARASK